MQKKWKRKKTMRTIKSKNNSLGRYDDVSPFLIESGVLELKIELPERNGEFYFVSELNKKQTVKPIIGGIVVLDGLEAGELRAAVKHYLRGELIEVFKIEPLLLKAVEKDLSAMPEFALLTGELVALKERTETLEKRLIQAEECAERADKRLEELQTKLNGLMEYAYLSYRENVRLNVHDLTKEEFVSAIVEGGLQDEL